MESHKLSRYFATWLLIVSVFPAQAQEDGGGDPPPEVGLAVASGLSEEPSTDEDLVFEVFQLSYVESDRALELIRVLGGTAGDPEKPEEITMQVETIVSAISAEGGVQTTTQDGLAIGSDAARAAGGLSPRFDPAILPPVCKSLVLRRCRKVRGG